MYFSTYVLAFVFGDKKVNDAQRNTNSHSHTSQFQSLCLTKNSSEAIQIQFFFSEYKWRILFIGFCDILRGNFADYNLVIIFLAS